MSIRDIETKPTIASPYPPREVVSVWCFDRNKWLTFEAYVAFVAYEEKAQLSVAPASVGFTFEEFVEAAGYSSQLDYW